MCFASFVSFFLDKFVFKVGVFFKTVLIKLLIFPCIDNRARIFFWLKKKQKRLNFNKSQCCMVKKILTFSEICALACDWPEQGGVFDGVKGANG